MINVIGSNNTFKKNRLSKDAVEDLAPSTFTSVLEVRIFFLFYLFKTLFNKASPTSKAGFNAGRIATITNK